MSPNHDFLNRKSSENEAAAVENSVDGEGTEEKPSSTEEPPSSNQTPPAPTESERKRKRSSENQPGLL